MQRKTLKKITPAILLLAGLLAAPLSSRAASYSEPNVLTVFHSPVCHKCVKVKAELMPVIEKKFKGRVAINYRDVTDMENYKALIALKAKYAPDLKVILPVFFLRGKFLNGRADMDKELEPFINFSLGAQAGYVEEQAAVDLLDYFKSFTALAIISAGLIDGINPCAFTVIVFFISFLALQGYRKRELVVIGLSFIASVCATYILIGLGFFNFLYWMKGFQAFIKVFNIAIGLFSIILGFLAARDFIKFKKTGSTEGLTLQLPASVKNQIHRVIGSQYRKGKEERQVASATSIFQLVVSALVTGFLVSLLEAVCTGQTYVPTIGFILKTTQFKPQALGFLLLYNFMFIVPLLVIFFLALFGVTSGQFSSFLKKHMLTIKALMCLLFFGLGIFIIWRA